MLNYISVPLFLFDEGRNIQAKKSVLWLIFLLVRVFFTIFALLIKSDADVKNNVNEAIAN